MAPPGLFFDSNLIVLYVVGNVDQDFIAKHRRLRDYSRNDFELLLQALAPYQRILVTPNTLSEASNLLAQHEEPERSLFLAGLGTMIRDTEEIVVTSAQASLDRNFERLGLTDAALLQIATGETPVITADFDLYVEVARRRQDAALNFTHLRAL